jgi:hypothetical protein
MRTRNFLVAVLAALLSLPAFAQDLLITAVYDGPLSGGTPKGVELYAINAIPDLSLYGVGITANANTSDGSPDFTFPADAIAAGSYIYVTANETEFNTFFAPETADYISGSLSGNGDDQYELYFNGALIDIYGVDSQDGTGTPWEYQDSWAYRNSGTSASTTWNASDWTVIGINEFDGTSVNGDATNPMPIGTYTAAGGSFDCPSLSANIGDSCDDLDAGTFDDTVQSDCTCVGTPYDCAVEQANFGDACDDGNASTLNDIIQNDCSCAGTPITLSNALIITAVYDGPVSGAPKGVELYALDNIADLSQFGIGSANNGGGSSGVEYTFPADALAAGTFIFVSSDATSAQTYFESTAVNYDAGSSMSINGDDAIELFEQGQIIDTFGDINTDGSGEPWEYADGWAARKCSTGPDGATFVLGNWTFSGIDAFDGTTLNSQAANPMPVAGYLETCPAQVFGCTNDQACNYDSTATDDDGSCVLPGDACDDEDGFTANDSVQGDCSCAGTAVTFCPASVVFTPVEVTLNSSGNAQGAWTVSGNGFEVNGFCGSGCQETVDTWIVSDPYDFSGITSTGLYFESNEGFGVTDLTVQYSTDYAGDPSTSTWTTLATLTEDGNIGIDLSVLAGVAEAYIGIRYSDDGADGYSAWLLESLQFGGDCPAAVTVFDCQVEQANFGDTCDDGDATTFDDVIQNDCSCAGTPFDCPVESANFGDACDDNDPLTTNDIIQNDCSCAGTPVVLSKSLIITAVYDGPLTGGVPKGIELYALDNIADLSVYGIGTANNGGGTDGVEYTFPADAVAAGTFFFVSTNDTSSVQYFESAAVNYNGGTSAAVSGDDAVELFEFGVPIDRFGDINVDGSGQVWEYTDSWAVRKCSAQPDTIFDPNGWDFGGVDALDGTMLNSEATNPMPVAAFLETCPAQVFGCTNDQACNYDATATDDDGSCVLPGDACDDGDAFTVNDTVQPDCSCLGAPVTLCQAVPVWTPAEVLTNSSFSANGAWETITDGFSVNGFCGGGCAEPLETWIVSNGYDFTGVPSSDLLFNANESFGVTDLYLNYTTSYNGDPAASTWIPLDTLTADGSYTVDLDVLNGLTEVYFGFQYIDDGADGYSDWEITNINLAGDCPVNITVFDCPTEQVNFGDACDDGDALTINDIVQNDCSCAGTPVTLNKSLIITAVYDGPLTGGVPKGIELYALDNIADLSVYGIGSANNGGGTDGVEYTFPADAVAAGTYFFVSSDDASAQTYFESSATNYNAGAAMGVNGDDAIELFEFGVPIDRFGDILVDGSGQTWDYADSWAVRNCGTVADTLFVDTDWTFGGVDAFDGTTLNSEAANPMPVAAYLEVCAAIQGCTTDGACNYNPAATEDDGSCILPVANCSECNATNDGLDLIDTDGDGVCDADEVAGCTTNGACNYDPTATDDDGSCIIPVANCSECNATNDGLDIIDSDGDGICDADDTACVGDLDGDGFVDVNDFLVLLTVFNTSCD